MLTKRGADILVRVEKLLDDAGKTAGKTSANDTAEAGQAASSSALAFPENYAAATRQASPAPRKN